MSSTTTDRPLFNDYTGTPRPMPTPIDHRRIGSMGNVELWQKENRYAVVYGLQMKHGLTKLEAIEEFSSSVLHDIESNGTNAEGTR